MPITANDLVLYGSAQMPSNDSSACGGAIDLTTRVISSDVTIWNSFSGAVEILSSASGDTTQQVTITGRLSSGVQTTEVLNLDGTSVVTGATTFARLEKLRLSSSCVGTVTVRRSSDDALAATLEPGLFEVRRPFLGVAAEPPSGGPKLLYEKIFAKNNHGTLSLLSAEIEEVSDPENQLTFALATSVNDSVSVANRQTTPSGLTFNSSAKAIPGGNLASGAAIGIWLELSLPAGDPATLTSWTMRLSGETA